MNKQYNGIYRNKGLLLLEALTAQGKRTFTTREAQHRLDLSQNNTLAILAHLGRQKRILSLSRGCYAIWPPAERKYGLHPLPILDALMRFRKTRYYVGLLSAADRYGATHHKPQVLQVLLPKQMRFRKARPLGISFHTHKRFPSIGIVKAKNPSGAVCFSSPELTALDLLYFESACGGFGNVCLVLRALTTQLQPEHVREILEVYPYAACIQRLGFLLTFFKSDATLLQPFQQWAKNKRTPTPLSSGHPRKGPINSEWGIIQNARIEVE